ncbi:homoserine kinase [Thermodesulfobacteriota bacterium]
MKEWLKIFAPASVANVGPGYDVLGFAIEGLGDLVEARRIEEKTVRIIEITGDDGKLPRNPSENTAGIAARETLQKLNVDAGVELKLHKQAPLKSGTGSSGISAAASSYAVNLLFGSPLSKEELVKHCLTAESKVSGYHADNVAASLLGGFILVKGYEPLEIISLGHVENLYCILVIPEIELPTSLAREVLPGKITVQQWVHNSGHTAAIVAGILLKDTKLIGRSIRDVVVEPARTHLIPGFSDVKWAAFKSGAIGCSISGGGPSVFALCDMQENCSRIAESMKGAFKNNGVSCKVVISEISRLGAREVK